jgi:peroxiredoxin
MIPQSPNPLPDWSLETIHGETVPTLTSFRGKPLLILFFDMDCPGCKGRAIPFANRLIVEKRGVEIIGIHSKFKGGPIDWQELKDAKQKYYFRFPYFQDAQLSSTFFRFRALGTPHWFLLDENGKTVFSLFGSDPNNGLLKLDLAIEELTGVGPTH